MSDNDDDPDVTKLAEGGFRAATQDLVDRKKITIEQALAMEARERRNTAFRKWGTSIRDNVVKYPLRWLVMALSGSGGLAYLTDIIRIGD